MAVCLFSDASLLLHPFGHSAIPFTSSPHRLTYTKTSAFHRFSSLRRYSPPLRAAFVENVNWFEIDDCVREGSFEDAIRLYIRMLECGVLPSVEEFGSFPSLIKAFAGVSDELAARQIHGQVTKLGVLDDVSIANSILAMYWKFSLEDALFMFEKMHEKDSVTWNTMISGFCRTGDYSNSLAFFRQMVRDAAGLSPTRVAFTSVLSSCAAVCDLILGREVHGHAVKSGLSHDPFLVTSLIDMYMKCGDICNAEHVFRAASSNHTPRENPVVWNAMIFGYALNGCTYEALAHLIRMLDLGVKPDSSTLVSALISCRDLLHLRVGEQVHGFALKIGQDTDVRVQTALIDIYFRCGNAKASENVFRNCQGSNLVMWGSMIAGYVQDGFPDKALELYNEFVLVFSFADSVIILAALRACCSLNLSRTGLEFHGLAIKLGFSTDVFIGTALVDLYAKCGDVKSARNVFHRLSARDVISWNSLISGYAQNEYADEALKLLRDMQSNKIKPNAVTVASVLSVCAYIAGKSLSKEIHGYVLRHGLGSNILVSNALLTAYAKCGDMDAALFIFNNMEERDRISWNSVILGLGIHGRSEEAFSFFDKMRFSGVTPDHATFTAVLSACSHSGRVDKGWEYFRSLADDYDLKPRLEQYTCMVDLLGRSGNISQAYDLTLSMPFCPDDKIWGSLLGSCKIYGDERLAKVVAGHIFEVDPDTIGYRVLLANLYEDYEKWGEVNRVRSEIRDRGLKKTPGCSWIEVSNRTHVFSAGDCSHELSQDIYANLESLTSEMAGEGYVPELKAGSSFQDPTQEHV